MSRRRISLLLAVLALAGISPARGQRACVHTENDCPDQASTVSIIQLGGAGSLSSNGSAYGNPGRLDDGTIAEADLEFTFDRSTGQLTLTVRNQSTQPASLTGLGFSTAAGVTGLNLLSHDGNLPWELAFDLDREDAMVDSHPLLQELKLDGFGRMNVLIANNGIDTAEEGGVPAEIPAGQNLTFLLQVAGDPAGLTACSFTGTGSWIPPGDKIVTAVGRFQAGALGGSGFISPCGPGGLLVDLAAFNPYPEDGRVLIRWETSSETDNAGFALLRREVRTGATVRLNETLIPGAGGPFAGASYVFVDRTAQNGVKYEYRLEDYDLRSFNALHPPRLAVPNPTRPPIRLLSPSYDETAPPSVVLRWESSRRMSGTLELSRGPLFHSGETISLPVGGGNKKRLPARVLRELRRMAVEGEGGVYWRVSGRSLEGLPLVSQVYFLVMES